MALIPCRIVRNAMDPLLHESMGLNTENLLISHPDCAENLLSVVDTLTKSGSVDVIVVDSVAALVPQHEIDTVVRKSLKSGRAEEVTCGGNALKFYSAVRLRMIRTRLLKITEDRVYSLAPLLTCDLNKFQCHVPQRYVLCIST
ncbi:hypothetical protein POTOM_051505 [Populus tomentosa]|uniref:RecA family profile 2 domain-containing protein n=1 Tax=Populus tomentosa TaxID=118781 RepID=A0A8X7YGH3_POPTO|nr:hypothetical protein POTOM_051505 [Populus tomentosa]